MNPAPSPRSAHRHDPTGYGFSQDDLPPLDHGPLDLRSHFHFPPPPPPSPLTPLFPT